MGRKRKSTEDSKDAVGRDMREHDRVTAVLSPFSGVEFVPSEILQRAAERGTRVHKIIDGIILGFECDEEVESDVAPYIVSFKKFWADSQNSLDGHLSLRETRFFCDEKKITGQLDFLVVKGDKTLIFDWKTSQEEQISWKLQGAAYQYLAEINGYRNIQPVIFVQLSKYGAGPKLYSYGDQFENICAFFKCLDIYRFFDMKNTRGGM